MSLPSSSLSRSCLPLLSLSLSSPDPPGQTARCPEAQCQQVQDLEQEQEQERGRTPPAEQAGCSPHLVSAVVGFRSCRDRDRNRGPKWPDLTWRGAGVGDRSASEDLSGPAWRVPARVEVKVGGGWGWGCRWGCRWEDEESEGEGEEGGLRKEGGWTTQLRADRPRDRDPRDKYPRDKDPSEVLPPALSTSTVGTPGRLALQHRAPQQDRVDPLQGKGTEVVCHGQDKDQGGKMSTAMVTADPPVLWTARKVCDRGYKQAITWDSGV